MVRIEKETHSVQNEKSIMVSLKVGAKTLGVPKGKIKDMIKGEVISFELKNGIYYIDIEEVREILLTQEVNPNLKPLPKIIKNILIEMHKDFQSSPIESDLKKVFKKINNGKDSLHIIEAAMILEYVSPKSEVFMNHVYIDPYELENNSINYYEELQKNFFDKAMYRKSLQYLEILLQCEHFILFHYIQTNYSIFQ